MSYNDCLKIEDERLHGASEHKDIRAHYLLESAVSEGFAGVNKAIFSQRSLLNGAIRRAIRIEYKHNEWEGVMKYNSDYYSSKCIREFEGGNNLGWKTRYTLASGHTHLRLISTHRTFKLGKNSLFFNVSKYCLINFIL